ncbi:hypothetical protein GCM10020219_060950 [Nonomuraea dietziae]
MAVVPYRAGTYSARAERGACRGTDRHNHALRERPVCHFYDLTLRVAVRGWTCGYLYRSRATRSVTQALLVVARRVVTLTFRSVYMRLPRARLPSRRLPPGPGDSTACSQLAARASGRSSGLGPAAPRYQLLWKPTSRDLGPP